MPDFDTILEKAEAFAGLIIFVVGIVVCYLAVAFLYFDLHPTNWGWFGRLLLLVAIVGWSFGFADAVKTELMNDAGEE